MASALLLLPNLGRRWEEYPPLKKRGWRPGRLIGEGRNWGRLFPGTSRFSRSFWRLSFFSFYSFLFIFLYPPPFFFILEGKENVGFLSLFLSSSPFFSWIETHISPFFECEEVPYLRVVLSPAGGILALSPLQQYSLQLLTLICTRDSIFFFLFTFAFFYHYYFLGFFFFSFKRPRYVCLSFICSHFFLRRVLSRFNTQFKCVRYTVSSPEALTDWITQWHAVSQNRAWVIHLPHLVRGIAACVIFFFF